jgi:protein farnesyltransferase subunit beta
MANLVMLDAAQVINLSSLSVSKAEQEIAERRATERTEQTALFLSAPEGPRRTATAHEEVDRAFEDVPFLDEEVGALYCNQRRLQHFVLQCCQEEERGGLMDKPGHPNDAYHTCYALSGLSNAQDTSCLSWVAVLRGACGASPSDADDVLSGCALLRHAFSQGWLPSADADFGAIGPPLTLPKGNTDRQSMLKPNNPIVNICRDRVAWTLKSVGRSVLGVF